MTSLFDDTETRAESGETAPTLAVLSGSEKQIKWAEDLRPKKLSGCRAEFRRLQELTERYRIGHPAAYASHRERLLRWTDALERLEGEASAKWWIDHRDNAATELLNGSEAKPGDTW